MAGGLELLLAGSMRIFGIAKRRPSAEVAGSAISLALDTRQTVGDALGLLHSRRFSCAPTIFAVDTVIAVKWNFYSFVSRWHKSVLEVRWRRQARALPRAPSGSGA